jgi:ribonuclease VapC
MKKVFDTSAVLAALFMEPGGEQVAQLWSQGDNVMSAVNYAELVSKLNERGMSELEITVVLEGVPLVVVNLDQDSAHAIGLLRKSTKKLGLSLGDRACLALGEILRAQIITADEMWSKLPGFNLLLIR